VVWGGLAAFVTQVPRFYALIEGLGYMFQGGRWLAATVAKSLYRLSLLRSRKVIFLNPDNKFYFLSRHIIKENKAALIDGIGLDLDWYKSTKLPEGAPVFLCIARLLGEKGLREYVAAADQVKVRYPEAVFNLLGPLDPSPDGIPLKVVDAWIGEGKIQYLGEARDVRPLIEKCHVYVLPSYHEGMPRTVLEAMAIGRPILTTDVPGCRETVVQGENGYLVPKKNVGALYERMIWFIENRDQWERMGQVSRRMAENRFDVHKINAELLRLMDLSGKN
jgi:glycosyltransferase involved in cell wall biosynthesis